MCKIQLGGVIGGSAGMTLVDLVDGEPQAGMIVRWAPVIEVIGIRRRRNSSASDEDQNGKHDGSRALPRLWGDLMHRLRLCILYVGVGDGLAVKMSAMTMRELGHRFGRYYLGRTTSST